MRWEGLYKRRNNEKPGGVPDAERTNGGRRDGILPFRKRRMAYKEGSGNIS